MALSGIEAIWKIHDPVADGPCKSLSIWCSMFTRQIFFMREFVSIYLCIYSCVWILALECYQLAGAGWSQVWDGMA